MCEIAYLSIKNSKSSRALKCALDPGCSLLASLRRQLSASEAGAPPDQILDPRLIIVQIIFIFIIKGISNQLPNGQFVSSVAGM